MKAATTIFVLLCAILSFCVPSFSQPPEEKMRVAVVEFDEKGDIGIKDAAAIVAECLISAISKTGKYSIIERPLLKKVSEEKGFQLTDKVDPETATKFSTVYGIQYIITGSVMKWGSRICITSRLISVDNAEIVRDEKIWADTIDEVADKVQDMGKLLTVSREEITERQARREQLQAAVENGVELQTQGKFEEALEVLSSAANLANTDEEKETMRILIMVARIKAGVSRVYADFRTIGTALETYYVDNSEYPSENDWQDELVPLYIMEIPNDPFSGAPYRYYTDAHADEPGTAWLLVSNGPDGDVDVTEAGLSWADTDRVPGELGGSSGLHRGYGLLWGDNGWYVPWTGLLSGGDVGRAGGGWED